MKEGRQIDPRIAARHGHELAAKRAAFDDIVEQRLREDRAARRLHRLVHFLAPYNSVIVICVVSVTCAMRFLNFGVYTILTYVGIVIAFSILFHLAFSILVLPIRPFIVSGWISHLLFVLAHGFFVDGDPFGGANHSQNGFTALFAKVLGTRSDINWEQSQEAACYSAIALAITYCFIIVRAKPHPSAQL